MEILAFLIGLGCLVLIVWAIALFGSLVFGRKRRARSRPHGQPPSPPPELRPPFSSQRSLLVTPVPGSKVIALKQAPASTRVCLPSKKHQQYIRLAALVLEQLRDGEVQLPKALGILRKMNPYAFEELLLTCCHEQGWEIERNFKYSNDGGLNGRVTIAGRLYLIQAKRYRGYINPQHIRDFHRVIEKDTAVFSLMRYSSSSEQTSFADG